MSSRSVTLGGNSEGNYRITAQHSQKKGRSYEMVFKKPNGEHGPEITGRDALIKLLKYIVKKSTIDIAQSEIKEVVKLYNEVFQDDLSPRKVATNLVK